MVHDCSINNPAHFYNVSFIDFFRWFTPLIFLTDLLQLMIFLRGLLPADDFL